MGLLLALLISQPAMAVSPGCSTINAGSIDGNSYGIGLPDLYLYQGEAIRFQNSVSGPLDAWIGNVPTPIPVGQDATFIVSADGAQYVGWGRNTSGTQITVTCAAPPAPRIISVTPTTGPATGGTGVAVVGSNFFSITELSVGGISVPFTVRNDGTRIEFVTPQHISGTVLIQISTRTGIDADFFIYLRVATSIFTTFSNLNAATGTLIVMARVHGDSGTPGVTPSGTLALSVDGTSLAPETLDYSGSATLIASNLAPGPRNIQINYLGVSEILDPSHTTLSLNVPRRVAAVGLGSSPNPSVHGLPVTLTATVTAAIDTPTGTVTFYDGNQSLGTSPLNAGAASVTVSALSTGAHNFTATYSGDDNLQSVTSAVLSHAVGRIPTTVSVSASPNPSWLGQEVSFTAQVQAGTGSPTGLVTFLVDGNVIGTAALANGVATYATTQLSTGPHNIVARYDGSTDYAGASSAPLAHTVEALASLSIHQVTSGGDGAFGFAITPSATTVLVTTMAGRGQSAPVMLPAGNYTITADDMRAAGFALTDLICTDPDGTVDVAGRSASVTLGAGEAVVCTFTALNSAEATTKLIKDFMETRASLLLDSLPGSSRRIGRLNGTAAGTISPGAMLMGYLPAMANGTPLQVSGSLAAIDTLVGNRQPSRFDAWVEASFTLFDAEITGGQLSTVALGADYLVNDDLLLGAFVQFDSMRQSTDPGVAVISGQGWLAGPYATLRLTDNLYLDLLAAIGGSSNQISPFGTYTDAFSAERYLVQATLEGAYTTGDWTFAPRASLGYFEEATQSYVDSLGVTIPAITAGVGKIALGPGVIYDFRAGDGVKATAGIRLDGVLDIRDGGATPPHADLNANLDFTLDKGARIGLDLGYGGIGSNMSVVRGKVNIAIAFD